MLEKFREKRNEESGFTLVELLVVMLILGILAAIAIPAFFSQRNKGYDSDAKADARSVQTAEEAYAIDNNGSYTATKADLEAIEGTITGIDAADLTLAVGANTYTITVDSKSGNSYTVTRAANGTVTNTCTGTGCKW